MRTLSGFVVVAAAALASLGADAPKAAVLGQPAYQFTLDDIAGTPIKLADHRGKVVLLDFFETYCPACNATMPFVVGLEAKYKSLGLVVLAIDREKNGDKIEAIKAFAGKHKIRFPVIMLTGAMKETMWDKYDVSFGIPHFIAIDRKGVVRHKQAGANNEALEVAVRKLLDEKS